MANALYGLGRNKFARGEIVWKASGGDTIRACLLKSTYSPSIDSHEFFTSISSYVVGNSGGATRADCPSLTLADPALGVCNANNVTITAVPGAAGACGYIALFKDGGTDGTSPLIALFDSGGTTGLPVTPNGGDITIAWDTGANKIFKL